MLLCTRPYPTASQSTPVDPRTRRSLGAPLDAPAKNIKHDRYLSHGRARPNARGMYAHTWFPGARDVRRQPQPTDSAARGARVRQALVVGPTVQHPVVRQVPRCTHQTRNNVTYYEIQHDWYQSFQQFYLVYDNGLNFIALLCLPLLLRA